MYFRKLCNIQTCGRASLSLKVIKDNSQEKKNKQPPRKQPPPPSNKLPSPKFRNFKKVTLTKQGYPMTQNVILLLQKHVFFKLENLFFKK